MTTEEKLNRFMESAISDAQKQSSELIQKTESALEEEFIQYQKYIDSQMEAELKAESENTRQQLNKELARKQLEIKRTYSKKQEELKEKILVEVKNKLAMFMNTPDYQQLLVNQIREALHFAGNDEIIIYIDPEDSAMIASLQATTGAAISVSDYAFNGGMRAIIRSKNILIDNSFKSRLEEAASTFTFTGGRAHD